MPKWRSWWQENEEGAKPKAITNAAAAAVVDEEVDKGKVERLVDGWDSWEAQLDRESGSYYDATRERRAQSRDK